MIENDDRWEIANCILKEKGIIQHQIESFNKFINNDINEIISSTPNISYSWSNIKIKNINYSSGKIEYIIRNPHFNAPNMIECYGDEINIYPNDARIRSLTYSSVLTVDIEEVITIGNNKQSKIRNDVYIGKIPIMVKSDMCRLKGASIEELYRRKECPLDPGGYFIISGSERVIVSQETIALNHLMIYKLNQPKKYLYNAKIYSFSNSKCGMFEIGIKKNETIYANFNYIDKEINVIILLMALGCKTDKEIFNVVNIYNDNHNKIIAEILRKSFNEVSEFEEEKTKICIDKVEDALVCFIFYL